MRTNMMKKQTRKIGLFALAVSAIMFLSCEVGLGPAIDQKAPEVYITSPAARENVPQKFNVTGTAYDNEGITRFILTMGENVWKYEDSTWTKNGASTSDGTWTELSKGRYTWEIRNVSVDDISGEYTIKVNVYDERENTSDTSVAARTVIYDIAAPKVTISSPALYSDFNTIKTELPLTDKNYKNPAKISKYLNKDFTIQGNQEETFQLMFLRVYLENESGLTIWKSPLYLTKEKYLNNVKNLPNQDPDDYNYNGYIYSEGDEYEQNGSLRSFTVNVPDLSVIVPGKGPNTIAGGPITDKAFLKVITVSGDASGNIETEEVGSVTTAKKTHGVFCYWPEADKPWIEFSTISPDTQDANLSKAQVYPGTKMQGYSYDDDGIKSVKATYQKEGSSVKETLSLYEKKPNESVTTSYAWSITAPKEDGTYYLEISTTDIYGVEALTKTGYFKVTDINAPNITVSAPSQTEPLFGNKSGDFKFDISADDDSSIKSLKCVYLKTESDAAYYLNPNDSRWDSITTSTVRKDSNGNLCWNIPLKSGGTFTGASGTRNKYVPSSDFEFNLFEEVTKGGLGIDGKTNKLSGQHFIFRAEDNGKNKITLDYAIQGDITQPEISIDEFYIGSTKYSEFDGKNFTEDLMGKTIKLTGTWYDDSIKTWQDTNRLSDFSITWNNKPITASKSYNTTTNKGTWSAEFDYNNSYSAGAVVALMATIADYAGNSASDKKAFTIDSELPKLESITAQTPNGSYGANVDIPIVLKFNKSIAVTGSPTLSLNNGGTATFDNSTNNTQNLTFNYKSASGQDTPKLNVTGITGGTFKSGATEVAVTTTVIKSLDNENTKKNLANTKSIEIVTTAPTLKSASVEDDYLVLEFSANVSKNKGDITITQTDATLTKVPAVLTESEYKLWHNKDSNVKNYYTKGTNGADASGKADLATKYILNYNLDSNDSTVLASYKKANLHKVVVSVKSSAVTKEDTNLKINLKKFPLPCLGATYTVSVGKGLITNIVGTENLAGSKNFTLDGVETPVIRINKSRWSFNPTSLTSKQPTTSQVKIDCETTGAEIVYGTSEKRLSYTRAAAKINLGDSENTNYAEKDITPIAAPTSLTKKALPFNIGDSTWENGQTIFIAAKATTSKGTSLTAYEVAYRSVFVFDEDNEGYGDTDGTGEGEMIVKAFNKKGSGNRTDGKASVWIRGGDAETGPVTTAGFPLSWDETDYKKTNGTLGAALLQQEDPTKTGGKWYYVTWELTTTAYIGVMMGITDEDSFTQGPKEWCYGKNSWVPFKKWYPLFPGESRYCSVKDYSDNHGTIYGKKRGNFGFKNETTDRNGKLISYGSSGSGGLKKHVETNPINVDLTGLTGQQYIPVSIKITSSTNFKKIFLDVIVHTNSSDITIMLADGTNNNGTNYGWNENGLNGTTYTGLISIDAAENVTSIEYKVRLENFTETITEDPTLTNVVNAKVPRQTEIFKGSITVDWNGSGRGIADSSKFATAKANDILIIKTKVTDINSWQVQLSDLGKDFGNWNGLTADSNGEITLTYTLTEENATKVKNEGLNLAGSNATITSIMFAQ